MQSFQQVRAAGQISPVNIDNNQPRRHPYAPREIIYAERIVERAVKRDMKQIWG